jgi:hypothetical protein
MNERDKRSSFTPLLWIAFLPLALAVYVGAYFALVMRYELARDHDAWWLEYRFVGRRAETFFAPVHRIDRRLRRSYWEIPRAREIDLSEFGEETQPR